MGFKNLTLGNQDVQTVSGSLTFIHAEHMLLEQSYQLVSCYKRK